MTVAIVGSLGLTWTAVNAQTNSQSASHRAPLYSQSKKHSTLNIFLN